RPSRPMVGPGSPGRPCTRTRGFYPTAPPLRRATNRSRRRQEESAPTRNQRVEVWTGAWEPFSVPTHTWATSLPAGATASKLPAAFLGCLAERGGECLQLGERQ